jgi:hypothetical protein
MNLDHATTNAILLALRKRELECELQGLSGECWHEALRKFRLAMTQDAATELRMQCDEVPMLLRKQA